MLMLNQILNKENMRYSLTLSLRVVKIVDTVNEVNELKTPVYHIAHHTSSEILYFFQSDSSRIICSLPLGLMKHVTK